MAVTPVDVKKTPAPRPVADPAQNLRSEFDRLFDRFGALGWPSVRRMFDLLPPAEQAFTFKAPAVDVTEDDKGYTIAAELPGLDEKDVDVSVTGDVLSIKGEKRQEKEEKNKNWYVSERAFGSFERSFQLPDGVDRDAIAAAFTKGVLTVTLPKRAEAQKEQKKIEIKAA